MDNYAAHKHPKVKAWLAEHPRIHVHFTPTHASWMNLVEVWFSLVERQAIHRGTFTSVKDLNAKIRAYIDGQGPRRAGGRGLRLRVRGQGEDRGHGGVGGPALIVDRDPQHLGDGARSPQRGRPSQSAAGGAAVRGNVTTASTPRVRHSSATSIGRSRSGWPRETGRDP